jgi:O-acetylhomoserine/O-acetylserine sulfhydrylase-like pyridoxal-dependent enzyme
VKRASGVGSASVSTLEIAVFEQRFSAIEGGVAALAAASGQSASAFSILNLAEAGNNIVNSTDLYAGTRALFATIVVTTGASSDMKRGTRNNR